MGFVDWVKTLFGPRVEVASTPRAAAAPAKRHGERNVTLTDSLVIIIEPSFMGLAHRSPNERWILGFRDSDGATRGGHRESGNGRVVLADAEKDVVMADICNVARPMSGAVSNTGRFVVNDGGFGSALQGDVVAFDPNGVQRFHRRYGANIFNLAISKCGRYAAVQTCSAPSDDGNLLEVLDLDGARIVFSVQPATGWAEDYVFELDTVGQLRRLGVLHKGLGRFNYSSEGQFEDRSAFQEARLAKGDYAAKIMAIGELIKADPTPVAARRAIEVADAALVSGAKDRPDWGSTAHRLRGGLSRY